MDGSSIDHGMGTEMMGGSRVYVTDDVSATQTGPGLEAWALASFFFYSCPIITWRP